MPRLDLYIWREIYQFVGDPIDQIGMIYFDWIRKHKMTIFIRVNTNKTLGLSLKLYYRSETQSITIVGQKKSLQIQNNLVDHVNTDVFSKELPLSMQSLYFFANSENIHPFTKKDFVTLFLALPNIVSHTGFERTPEKHRIDYLYSRTELHKAPYNLDEIWFGGWQKPPNIKQGAYYLKKLRKSLYQCVQIPEIITPFSHKIDRLARLYKGKNLQPSRSS